MQVILLIAGLILLLVNPPLFAAAGTVGLICLIVFGAITLFQIIAFLGVAIFGAKSVSRNRRGF